MMSRSSNSQAWRPATVTIESDEMTLHAGAGAQTVPVQGFRNGDRNGFATLAALAGRAAADGVSLRCCGSCTRFSFSGLSFQFSGGTRGYCALAGGHVADAEVDIAFDCGEQAPISGWPNDLMTMDRVRMEQRMLHAAPTRRPALAGAILGLVVAESLAGGNSADPAASLALWQRWEHGVERQNMDTFTSGRGECAIRGLTIGLMAWRDPARALALARSNHHHRDRDDDASEAEAAIALLVSLAMRKRTPAEMHQVVLQECGPRSATLSRLLLAMPEVPGGEPAIAIPQHPDHTRLGAEDVAAALYCVWQSPGSYQATVETAAGLAKQSSAIVAVAGGISGAFNGVDDIPREWRCRLEHEERLHAIADRLTDHFAAGGAG